MSRPVAATVGALRDTGYRSRPVKTEIRENLLERLRSGENMAATHPVMALRRIAIEQAANRKTRMQDWLWLAYVIKGWNFYRDGAEVSFIRMRLNGSRAENYPEPK